MFEPPWVPVRGASAAAVAVGNASFLGVGYLLQGRRGLAVANVVGTVVPAVLLVTAFPTVWFEIVVLVWWAAGIVHGWFLAGPTAQNGWRDWVVALAVAVPVLVVAALLRFDAVGIARDVADARESGDCAKAEGALDRVWFGHRLADAPLAAAGDATAQACGRLHTAAEALTDGLPGNPGQLRTGFDILAGVRTDLPGNERMADVVLDGFLTKLPAQNPCDLAVDTDWLRTRHEATAVVERTRPGALVSCADGLLATGDWQNARTRYQQALDQYPHSAVAARATEGNQKAKVAGELANVRSLLSNTSAPEYCTKPAPYSAAPPYGKGTNHAIFSGNDDFTNRLPAGWRVTDPTKAVLIVCAGDDTNGTAVRTCQYEGTFKGFPDDVTFHKIAIPLKAYELRTGKLVADTKVEIGGTSCPPSVSYTSYGYTDLGPPSDMPVDASDADVRAAFASLITR
ncbi:hypothetical protein QRX50_18610 [Amycolatopsis carbonis]|uniref:Tetratricopeptide repeat protein n=1 Tax=Amycolatopsis carbonis TaxID=715471 RepID=A0A9Y2ILQ0_9PSEU|nr:hypothetical protein [Amycolatopsis sp. 2-15]WIX82640.1 hypothetical protein QRX50_18610 [Amycolatopsis sp. 2-15]